VALAALDNGASIVNDITALKNPKMAKLIARKKCAIVLMHMQGTPRTMQKNPRYDSLMDDIIGFLNAAAQKALDAGIAKEKIIVDPGIGFGKLPEHNLEIIKNLGSLKVLGFPVLVGPSRKSFIGKILNAEPQNRLFGTVSACVIAAHNGAKIIRAHDVRAVRDALKIEEAIDYV